MYKKTVRRLFYLYTGEFVSTLLFAVLWALYLQNSEWTAPYLTSLASVYFFLLLEMILLQGSYYWFLKWKQVRKRDFSNLPDQKMRLFSFFKKVNITLIALGIPLMIYEFMISSLIFYWCLFLYLFAIIEQINYYHIRLSYLSLEEIKQFIRQKGFSKSKLAKEIEQYRNGIS
ncbi:hypothetical protein BEP19_11795 [Ammoniphilus oxalaticus]|uniref:General stress protein n=1 Tax=Ammoniphilus oxalaticus TaxID=66863 RepID=A0A419SGJ1_9BACL|nr:hypothetical protein [Ammoniphilus oxalaticus]RKD22912.1 hypothetical protein BEP19_11795 [Ammoniphilus oxalaticus]